MLHGIWKHNMITQHLSASFGSLVGRDGVRNEEMEWEKRRERERERERAHVFLPGLRASWQVSSKADLRLSTTSKTVCGEYCNTH